MCVCGGAEWKRKKRARYEKEREREKTLTKAINNKHYLYVDKFPDSLLL